MFPTILWSLAMPLLLGQPDASQEVPTQELRIEVVDSTSGEPLPCRLYLHGDDGSWHLAASAAAGGTAVRYEKKNWIRADSVEIHTTLSAHPAVAHLPAGRYTLVAERGKEYLAARETVVLKDSPAAVRLSLRRWIDMASMGWYSGDTHVHRALSELPNVVLAEDLNVALPLAYWVTRAFTPPSAGDKNLQETVPEDVITVDPTHVIYPRSTEYEIFSVGDKRHTLGAVFVLGHSDPLRDGVPPLRPMRDQAREQGALFELDKHNWPWSMALVPLLDIDLYELSNNHIWRTEFAFAKFGEAPADYMEIERRDGGFTEWGWIDFGFQNYYALLNCGFRLRPTAGTASGVHPVPLGYGRVYVQLGGELTYEGWMRGLDAGRSFVTTGPMLLVTVDDQHPGRTFRLAAAGKRELRIAGRAVSVHPLDRIEVVVDGEIVETVKPANRPTERGARESRFEISRRVEGSGWLAVRCIERLPSERLRFAHTAPFHVEVPGRPLRPRRVEVEYLVRRVEREIERSRGTLPEAAIREYETALEAYRKLLPDAR